MSSALVSRPVEPPAARRAVPAGGAVRKPEWVMAAFLVYAALLSRVFPIAPSLQTRILLLNVSLLFAYGLLIRTDVVRPRLLTSVIRDWLPLGLLPFAYREVGWFALPRADYLLETRLVVWDRCFLRGGGTAVIESLGPVLPSVLEIAYALVYAVPPFCLAVLYVCGHRKDAGRFLLVVVTAVLLCYAQLPLWPSEPPRTVFPGEDLPAYLTIFRRFNLWTLAGCGIHTGVFPSAHVAGAFAAAFGMRRAAPSRRGVAGLLFTMAALIAVATVYGRYHYLADAVAGVLMAGVALLFSRQFDPAPAGPAEGRKMP